MIVLSLKVSMFGVGVKIEFQHGMTEKLGDGTLRMFTGLSKFKNTSPKSICLRSTPPSYFLMSFYNNFESKLTRLGVANEIINPTPSWLQC